MKSEHNERHLQNLLYSKISDPSKVYTTKSGKRLQILSPGRQNPHEGPDFLDVALLLNGFVVVGSAEYHKKSSDWNNHNHSSDSNYDNVVLHIVSTDDKEISGNFETLIIPIEDLKPAESLKLSENDKLSSIDDLQHFSLIRMLRKSSEAQKLLKQGNLEFTINEIAKEYLNRYNSRRRRPSYSKERLSDILDSLKKSTAYQFLENLKNGETVSIPDMMQMLIKKKIFNEGAHLRREIILNVILPISICLANEESRINLFLWYWSTPALNAYGLLDRRFPDLPQNFLWQQQGMLEYIKLHGKQTNVASEAMNEYAFGEILNFYQSGKSPFSTVPFSED